MIQKLCKLISYIFHPALMPVVGYLLFFFLLSSEPFGQRQVLFLSLIFLGTFAVPAFFLLTLRYTGFISSLDMQNRKERAVPFMFTTVFYTLLAYLMIRKVGYEIQVVLLTGGVALSMCLTTLVTLFHKTSVHSIGISGLLGFLFGFQAANTSLELLLPIVTLFFLTGMVMSSRLYLKAHTPNEVWSGFLIGFGTCFGIVAWVL
ncbi:phosphatase PAP2 family protein [Bernardetia sp. ABR2-2B]|uniref:phosphatase PAP2 family protein n=1 Tax=Bernardetia sp. ABR2-2B TaxID=3127472 RepID=UPI0030CD89E8